MWYIMQSIQSKYSLSERLIRTIAAIRSFPRDNVEDLIGRGADVNCLHGTLKPLHCACMVADADCVELLLQKEPRAQSPVSRLVSLLVRGLGTEREDSCLDLLHRATGHLELRKNGSLPWEVARDPQLCQRLALLCQAPATLQALSRYAVRRSLGLRFLPQAVQQLPLPACLKDYLLLLT
ncbi:hypothetical protein DUI87_33230 [Hirundo rustica rustica]|uniref:SOCS box domain-containing protein n=1 Tax=Hirundo rustica rustica TaxID=333673 RepID=A0A3M0INI7_HIRRU|nr:hypothetical protein DUI87_33230 [Hirundo rustica rustica]